MALILNIESSTTACSVALAQEGEVLESKQVNDGYSHSENLAVFVDEVLKSAGKETHELDAIAVSQGPGSYTGLRIGVSLAKGICYGAEKPLLAIDTLGVMTLHPVVRDALKGYDFAYLCPMLDARRMEVFTATYNRQGGVMRPPEALVLEESSYDNELSKGPVFFFGNGSEKFKELIHHDAAHFLDDVWPEASNMVELSEASFNQQAFADVAYFEPFYLKAFQGTTPKKRV